MPAPEPTPLSEARDSLQRVERAWRGKAGLLPSGMPGNMTQEDVKRCVALDTLGQLKTRIKRLSGR